MTGTVELIAGSITGVLVLLPVAAKALRSSGLLDTVSRLRQQRAAVQIVREQRLMAALPLPPASELSHSMKDGLRLVVRSDAVDADQEVMR